MNHRTEKTFKVKVGPGTATVEHSKTLECETVGPHHWAECKFWMKEFGANPAGLIGGNPFGGLLRGHHE